MKSLLLALAMLFGLAPFAEAQDWAKARLEASPRHQQYDKVKQGDREIECFVVYPEVKDKATAVVLIHEIFGLSDWVKSAADQLAEAKLRHLLRTALRRARFTVTPLSRRECVPYNGLNLHRHRVEIAHRSCPAAS